ncbi:hypothetical protein WJ966_00995 [Achromobacter xylosoxidans]
MMLAWARYLRHDGIPRDALETLDWAIAPMNWASLALTLPVVLYSAWPIWRHAGANLRQGRAGMDVPVALVMSPPSSPACMPPTGRGEVAFDSVTMFVAFLLTARYPGTARPAVVRRPDGSQRHARVEAQRLLGASADRLASRFVMAQVALALAAAAAWAYIDPDQCASRHGGAAADELSLRYSRWWCPPPWRRPIRRAGGPSGDVRSGAGHAAGPGAARKARQSLVRRAGLASAG